MRALRSIVLVCLAAAVAGWFVRRQDVAAQAKTGFAEKRLVFLEAENSRLVATLAAKQRAEDETAGNGKRLEIEAAIAQLRELDFTGGVSYREIGRDQLPTVLRQKLLQQVPEQEFADTGVALAALGLLPAGIDLQKTYLALLGEQIGAFYDQHSHELYTFTGHPLTNAQNRVVLAHELTHALQDQHFNLSRLPLDAKGDDDRAIAASALVEGDATLAMNQYMLGDLTAAALRDSLAGALSTDVRELAAAPKFLRESLLFPYLHGLAFCQTLFDSGGWAALDAAYSNPPASTAQILHPEKFLAGSRVDPVRVEFAETAVHGQKPIVDNVLGEFGARQLFASWLHDEPQAAAVAAGWQGDRYLVYGDAKANSYIWKVACADPAAANGFKTAVWECFRVRHRSRAGSSPGSWEYDTKGRLFRSCLTAANEVLVIDAQDVSWLTALERQFAPGVDFGDP